MNGAFVNGIGNISPQNTFGDGPLLEEVVGASKSRWTCKEPDYAQWIDAKAIRRMSRIIRMGVASASLALKEAGIQQPDAIITGTGYGCLDDTGIFLSKMISNQEQTLNPTPFIQSTHNSIGSQIALLLQCLGYNQTYVQGAFSLESSLLDALMMLNDNLVNNVLVGGIDEITEYSSLIISRFGLFARGAKQGEGSAFFLLSGKRGKHAYAVIRDLDMIYKPDGAEEIRQRAVGFLEKQSLGPADIDLILIGKSGDQRYDEVAGQVVMGLFKQTAVGSYKDLCGEYPTSSGFGIWLGASILKRQQVPAVIAREFTGPIKNVLVYNPYFGTHHSLILLQAC